MLSEGSVTAKEVNNIIGVNDARTNLPDVTRLWGVSYDNFDIATQTLASLDYTTMVLHSMKCLGRDGGLKRCRKRV